MTVEPVHRCLQVLSNSIEDISCYCCGFVFKGGTGAEAFVEIVKKEEGFIQGEMKSYKSNLEELNRLLGCLPASSVPQTVNLSATTTTSSSSTSIYHGETIDLT